MFNFAPPLRQAALCTITHVQRLVSLQSILRPATATRNHTTIASATLFRNDHRLIHSTSRKMGVHPIASEEEFEIIKRENKFIVLDAFATWCGPCKMIAPTIVNWSNTELKDSVFFAKFDVDELPKLAQELGVRAMPTFIFFKEGEKDGEFIGANAPGLLDLIKKKVADLGPAAPEATPETAPAATPAE